MESPSHTCFLESFRYQQLRRLYPHAFYTAASMRSDLVSNHVSVPVSKGGSEPLRSNVQTRRMDHRPISVQRILADEAYPMDGSTIYHLPQHFAAECEYTISTWAWIWKGPGDLGRQSPKQRRIRERQQRAIFSVRPFPGESETNAVLSSLFPAIILNVNGKNSEYYFFASKRDPADRYASYSLDFEFLGACDACIHFLAFTISELLINLLNSKGSLDSNPFYFT